MSARASLSAALGARMRERLPLPPSAHPGLGVVTVPPDDGGVGLPLPSVPVTVTAYVVPGARPARAQSSVGQGAVTGLPPPTGTAVTAYGPPVPAAGDRVTATLVGPVACTPTTGELAAGVVTDVGDDAGVRAPPEPAAVAVTE